MLPVVWTEAADEDLASITECIGEDNISAAERLWHRIRSCVLPLSAYPYLYPLSERASGLRESVAHPNYIILYRVTVSSIEIVSVIHARIKFPFL